MTWDTTNTNIHPLYLYSGTTCLENGLSPASGLSVTFSTSGTYFFHCGNHATGCAPNNTTCAATGCGGMACSIIVNAAAITSTPTNTATKTITLTPTNSATSTATFYRDQQPDPDIDLDRDE